MDFSPHPRYAHYQSKFISLTIDKSNQKLAFLGLDSGGRQDTRMNSYNMVMPTHGGRAAIAKGEPRKVVSDSGVTGGSFEKGRIEYRITDDRTFEVAVANKAPAGGKFFTMDLHIEAAPPSVWAPMRVPETLFPKPKKEFVLADTVYTLPMVVSFPDYGLVEISAVEGDIDCREEVTTSNLMSGLNLGGTNYGGHTAMMGLHYGYCRLMFRLKSPSKTARLRFRVLEEFYPQLPGCDVSGPEFDGLRRCWVNSFNLNRSSFSMGDNIFLNGLAHLCVHHKSDLALITPKFANGFDLRRVVEHQTEVGFKYGQAEDGEINWEYVGYKKKYSMTGFIDTTPSVMIGLEGISRWNFDFALKYIKNSLKAADFLMSLDKDGDGILEVTFSGRRLDDPMPDGGPRNRNWWDNFAFGHKDGAFNLLCHRALRLTADLAERCGEKAGAKKIRAFLKKFEANFLKVFYNPETGVIAGWIDSDGKMHDYMFTFMTAEAVTEGLVDKASGRKMLKILLKQMDKMGFNRNYPGVPGPTLPVPVPDTFDWPFMAAWPRYENGGLCGMPAFYFLCALYKCGLREEADKLLFSMLNAFENEDTHSGVMPGYMKSVDWRTKDGVPCGYNYLADNYYYLLSAYIGHFGVEHPAVLP